MNTSYITRALCFHGQPMQKIWEDERGVGDLQKCGVPQQPDYSIYQQRSKHFTFQDRAKRFKLHQFFAKKAVDLFDAELPVASRGIGMNGVEMEKAKSHIALMPPYEVFVNKNLDKITRWRSVLEGIKPGDIVYGVITKVNSPSTLCQMIIKPLCTAEPVVRYLNDLPTKAYLQHPKCGIQPLDKQGNPRNFAVNDFVCCEVVGVSVESDRLYVSLEGNITKNKDIPLGAVNIKDLPLYYSKANEATHEKYEDFLLKSKEFANPNFDILFEMNGLNVKDTFTLMHSLKHPFPLEDYATELRQTQASKWAYRSVANGIEYFKNGVHMEAFQCLNKALSIDPRNVEGLVARGALYANTGSFKKAVDDFEMALRLNSFHANARKYMGETLVALGRSYEEERMYVEAEKAYKDCLNIIPNHEHARGALQALMQMRGNQLLDDLLTNPVVLDAFNSEPVQRRPISDPSPESSASSDSESDSTALDSNRKKTAELSPLSRRMAMHIASMNVSSKPDAATPKKQFNQPFYLAYNDEEPTTSSVRNPNEFKLDDDDTEDRVRKLLQEASKHKKAKSKQSKKEKKSKESKHSKKNSHKNGNNFVEEDFLQTYDLSLNIDKKLCENRQLYEKTMAEIQKSRSQLMHTASSTSTETAVPKFLAPQRDRSETPPPPPMRLPVKQPDVKAETKLSFQIRRPVKVDKFGLVRIATPLVNQSPSSSRSRSRSPVHSRHRERDRSPRHRRSRTRSRSGRRGRRRSRSRSRSRSLRRSKRRSRTKSRSRSRDGHRHRHPHARQKEIRDFYGKRRTPSPFKARGTPPPRRRLSKTRSPKPNKSQQKFGNRVWQRPGYAPPSTTSSRESNKGLGADGRWLHDKYEEKQDDGPSIEEIDEIIKKAQKERKQEIIKQDKDILKKPYMDSF